MWFQKMFSYESSGFEIMTNLIVSKINKEDLPFRRTISDEDHLAVTLQYLETGYSYHSLSYTKNQLNGSQIKSKTV